MMINPQIFTMFDMTWVYNVRSCYVVVNMSTPFINSGCLIRGSSPKSDHLPEMLLKWYPPIKQPRGYSRVDITLCDTW